MKKVAIHNLGCKVNSYESESMELMLKNAGYEIVPFDENEMADVYIINTCSVTNIADRKSRQMLHKAKKMNPNAVVVAAGCYVQADSDNVKKDECVDIIIGNNMKKDIVTALEDYYRDNSNFEFMIDINDKQQEYEELTIDKVSEHTRAYIKIQDGCNQFCSYCIIPYLRGRIRSRAISDIENEVKRLAENGYKEIVLTGIHITSYGMDNGCGSLIEVLERVHDIEGIERIRLGSLEPRVLTDDFVERISRLSKLCPHFHLSLQSGCDSTLKAMNRKYTTKQYYQGCLKLRKAFDNPAITTDVIVGFPGETEEDFENTVSFLDKISFYEMHVFKYSRRKGTVADKMPNQISDAIKSERSARLLEMDRLKSAEFRRMHLNKQSDVLVEEENVINGHEYYVGYTKDYIRVIIDKNSVDEYNRNHQINSAINHIYDVTLTNYIEGEEIIEAEL